MTFFTNQIGRYPSYGYIWMNTANWTGVTFSMTTSYQELTALSTSFSLAPAAKDFVMTTDGRLKYTGIPTKTFAVDATLAVASSTFIKIYKNGSPLNDTENYTLTYCRVTYYLVDLATNDYISLWVKGSTSASRSLFHISLSATSTDRKT